MTSDGKRTITFGTRGIAPVVEKVA